MFGGYTREQLQEALRSIDPQKDPADYAAVQAAISRAPPTRVGRSCLDVTLLRTLDALVQPSTKSKALSIITAIAATVYVIWRLFFHKNFENATIYWENIALFAGISIVVWITALWKTNTNSYRFATGSVQCFRFGRIAWEQSLSELVWVEEIAGRYGSSLDFHWPTFTQRFDLAVSDFEQFGVVAKLT